ncbi:hypothetical protein ABW286_16355 [Erwinia papayae]|uniref:Uncharacterized protein n=1 Tax=Erwinia papayae TaxID=206499 RepID=A0ABV3N4Q4_9GAMM
MISTPAFNIFYLCQNIISFQHSLKRIPMPLCINSCWSGSTTSIDSRIEIPSEKSDSVKNSLSADGYETSSTKIKAQEIKPLASALSARLRMSNKEYLQYKELWNNLGLSEKKVRFAEPLSSENKYPDKGTTDYLKSEPVCTGAMFEVDADHVDHDELKHFLQQRAEQLKISDNSIHPNIPASALLNTLMPSQPPFDSTTPDHYDSPNKKPVPVEDNFVIKNNITT